MSEEKDTSKSSLRIGKRAFLASVIIIFCLMMFAGALTKILPAGSYSRVEKEGRTVIVPGSFSYTERPDYPFWRWFTAPGEVFAGSDSLTLITIVIFIIFISGAFSILENAGVMEFILMRIVDRFKARKYLLMAAVIFLFMFLAAFLGIYEAMVPLIVFIVPLAVSLGWDSLTGLGMSLLPLAFGFAAAVTNPFTIGVAQRIAELPLFSGAWLRLIFFCFVFGIVYWFVRRHAKKVEAEPASSITYKLDEKLRMNLKEEDRGSAKNPKRMKRATIFFGICMGTAILFILATSRVSSMTDFAFPVMALLFFIGGIGGGALAGSRAKKIAKTFFTGALGILPAILLLAMAYSVKHIIDRGGIIDTILYQASDWIAGRPEIFAAFLIYLLTLVMNFFIGSASAKAFLMMPILTPLADLVGITRQTAVLAFDFGDGFSNVFYPSNALLLIALGFTVVGYPKWVRWTFPLQLIMLTLTGFFLLVAVLVGFGPF